MKYEQVLMCFGRFRDTSWEADYAKAMSLVAAQTAMDNESALDAETLRYIIYRSTNHDRAQTEIMKGFTQLVAASATHSLSFSVETSCPMRSAISLVNLPTPTRNLTTPLWGPIANGPNLTSVAESPSHPSGFAKPDAAARNACRPDSNTGHLRHHIENGVKAWRVHLFKQDVKNHYSKAMKDGESRLLHDIGGRFYAILEEYLDWVRAFLLAGKTSDALIVRTSQNPLLHVFASQLCARMLHQRSS